MTLDKILVDMYQTENLNTFAQLVKAEIDRKAAEDAEKISKRNESEVE